MAKIQVQPNLSQVNRLDELKRFAEMKTEAIIAQVNGNLQFRENIKAAGPYVATFLNGTDPVAVDHNFGSIPQGFLVINLSAGIFVYKPADLDWTARRVWLQASAAGTATLYLV